MDHLRAAYGISERKACRATGFHRSSQRYRKRSDPQTELRLRLKDLAAARVRYGYRHLHVLLRREGWPVNHKRTYRLYREEGLAIRAKLPKRKRAWRYRQGRPEIGGPNEVWAMDFMTDQLFDGRPFRILTVVDCCTREALSIVPRVSFRAYQSGCSARCRSDHIPALYRRDLICRPAAAPCPNQESPPSGTEFPRPLRRRLPCLCRYPDQPALYLCRRLRLGRAG